MDTSVRVTMLAVMVVAVVAAAAADTSGKTNTISENMITAVKEGCGLRQDVVNGYYLEIKGTQKGSEYPAKTLLQFVCHMGYILKGPDRYLCTKGGLWLPTKEPQCEPSQELIESDMCSIPPEVSHTIKTLVRGVVAGTGAVEGTEVAYRCRPHYRDTLAPCNTHTLTCRDGKWLGTSPECKPFNSCMPPPPIPHGTLSDSAASSFPVQAQVYYQCGSGYKLVGPAVFTCQEDTGCWTPLLPPMCRRVHHYTEPQETGSERECDRSILKFRVIALVILLIVFTILIVVLALIVHQRRMSPKFMRLHSLT